MPPRPTADHTRPSQQQQHHQQQEGPSAAAVMVTHSDTLHDIMQESKIFQAISLGHQEYHQPNNLTSDDDDDTHHTVPLPYSLVYIDNTDSRPPSKQPRLGLPYTAVLEDDDDFQDSFLPLEASPEILIPESPRLCCLSESLSDVPELLLPPKGGRSQTIGGQEKEDDKEFRIGRG
ncbi:hypothetical protein FOZ63_008567 [Perkinsus olseni]|uniref:Uncharacterized protein n=1 Tax=Perkinsus olseni TaxID=32597 RepID=A0A7J6R4R4_PEROL|nr:hypothetical protein FOZ63_008567 [Perkinsus olseni]